jgi:hypothetical protein
MKLLTTAVIVIGALAAVNNIQQAHAADNIQQAQAVDNNGNDKKKPCNDQHSSSSTKCSQRDTTPLILPFP